MADKEVIELRDIERELYGYTGGKLTYSPAVFDLMEIPEDKRFTVDIEPMSDADCMLVRQINENIKTELFLWAGERGIDPANIGSGANSLAFYQKAATLDNPAEKFQIVFKYISNLKNHQSKTLTEKVWHRMPNKIREDIYNKVVEISNVSVGESINLS